MNFLSLCYMVAQFRYLENLDNLFYLSWQFCPADGRTPKSYMLSDMIPWSWKVKSRLFVLEMMYHRPNWRGFFFLRHIWPTRYSTMIRSFIKKSVSCAKVIAQCPCPRIFIYNPLKDTSLITIMQELSSFSYLALVYLLPSMPPFLHWNVSGCLGHFPSLLDII